MSNKAQDNDSLGLSDSTVMAEQASITAEDTSTSALGDEPTYDGPVREDIERGDFSQITDPANCSGNVGDDGISAMWISMRVSRS
jgi:hypothetical protein